MTFNQVYESEAHYRAVHVHSCSVCRKSLPSNHLLHLHIQARLHILICVAKILYKHMRSPVRPSYGQSLKELREYNLYAAFLFSALKLTF